jgi:uncharacterized protein YfiM (DUF2279 family)
MKKLLSILFIFLFINAFSQNVWKDEWLKQDKILHVTYSVFITSLAINTAVDMKVKNPEVVGLTLGLMATASKEFLFDEKPSAYDLMANVVGCVAGVYVNRMFNRWETKMYYKKK